MDPHKSGGYTLEDFEKELNNMRPNSIQLIYATQVKENLMNHNTEKVKSGATALQKEIAQKGTKGLSDLGQALLDELRERGSWAESNIYVDPEKKVTVMQITSPPIDNQSKVHQTSGNTPEIPKTEDQMSEGQNKSYRQPGGSQPQRETGRSDSDKPVSMAATMPSLSSDRAQAMMSGAGDVDSSKYVIQLVEKCLSSTDFSVTEATKGLPKTIPGLENIVVAIKQLKDEKRNLEQTNQTKIEDMKKAFKEREIKQKEESEDRERNFNDYIHQIEADNSRLKTTIEQLGAEVNQYRSFAEESHNAASKLDQMLKKSKEEIEKLKAEKIQQFEDSDRKIKKLTEEKKHIHSENIQLKSRVSELAGAKLMDNNPDIADLSDPNRAMKLGEKFSSLYDDDWTDLFQILTENFKMAEDAAINYLLTVLEGAYDFCRKIGDEQMDILCNVFDNPCQDIPKALTVKRQTEKSQLSQKHYKELKDLRKKIALNQVNSISKQYLALESEEAKKGDKTAKQLFDQTKSYYEKCVEVCWPMILHDPPVRMERKAQPGSKIDLNRFRLYGGNGSVMDYLVWPPLLVEGGGLLAKGVAKPKKEVRTVKKT